ncbi:MAG TPA: hypothetical protein VH561_00520 [Micromonosporaceae bacterium]|jgi:hypothetical protein
MSMPTISSHQGPTGGRGTVHGDLSQMAAPSRMNGLLYYAVLSVAAGIDIATFYQVLALVMRNVPAQVVWLGVVGFTVTALALAHTMGVRVRDRIDNGGRALGSASVWLLFMIWLFVGATAFIVRLTASPPQFSGGTTIIEEGQPINPTNPATNDARLAALLFLALYFATGTVAAVAGFLRHNSAAKQYAATLRTRASVAKDVAASAADLALARQTLVALDEERRRREEGWVKAQEEWQAIARRLKQEARLRLASAAQNPSVTDAYFDPPPYLLRPTSGAPALIQATGEEAPPPSTPPYALAPSSNGGQHGYQPLQPYAGQTSVPAVTEQAAPWRLNASPGIHRPQVDHGGSDRREVGR